MFGTAPLYCTSWPARTASWRPRRGPGSPCPHIASPRPRPCRPAPSNPSNCRTPPSAPSSPTSCPGVTAPMEAPVWVSMVVHSLPVQLVKETPPALKPQFTFLSSLAAHCLPNMDSQEPTEVVLSNAEMQNRTIISFLQSVKKFVVSTIIFPFTQLHS